MQPTGGPFKRSCKRMPAFNSYCRKKMRQPCPFVLLCLPVFSVSLRIPLHKPPSANLILSAHDASNRLGIGLVLLAEDALGQ